MASACVNRMGVPPESFLDYGSGKFQQCGWLSPRMSFGREGGGMEQGSSNKPSWKNLVAPENEGALSEQKPDPEVSGDELVDFEFRLEDPIKMLPADELFSNGRLLPLHLAAFRNSVMAAPETSSSFENRSPVTKCCPSTDPYLFSPKAPRCASHWKEILGLRKLYKNSNLKPVGDEKITAAAAALSSHKTGARCLKQFLNRSSKSSLNTPTDSSLNLPLLKDSDQESLTISARLSLSLSSSHDHDELHFHRFSVDSEKPCAISRKPHQTTRNATKVRVAKTAVPSNRNTMLRNPESAVAIHSVVVDSPRMNSSGKIVFHGLERSSSSPSSFNGGPRYKHRGMERSYSANVRVTPVLNVPVCSSLRGSSKSGAFGLPLFQKKETGSGTVGRNRVSIHIKNRS